MSRRQRVSSTVLCTTAIILLNQYMGEGYFVLRARIRRDPSASTDPGVQAEGQFGPISLPGQVISRLRGLQIYRPTPIQNVSMGAIFNGKNTIIHAETGSGKTLAYLLPLISRSAKGINCAPNLDITPDEIKMPHEEVNEKFFASLDPYSTPQEMYKSFPHALIVVPSRELAGQVSRWIDALLTGHSGNALGQGTTRELLLKCQERASTVIFSQSKSKLTANFLSTQTPWAIVGTPLGCARILYRRSCNRVWDSIDAVVFDEADSYIPSVLPTQKASVRVLDMVNSEAMRRSGRSSGEIIRDVGPILITASATMQANTRKMMARMLSLKYSQDVGRVFSCEPSHKPKATQCVKMGIGQVGIVPLLRHAAVMCREDGFVDKKGDDIASQPDQTGQPVDKWEMLGALWQTLQPTRSLLLVPNSMSISKATARCRSATRVNTTPYSSLTALANLTHGWPGDARVVVGSFRTARGINLRSVDCVFLFGVPATIEEYLHLAGRAGREGRRGLVVSLSTPNEQKAIQEYTEKLAVPLHVIDLEKESKIQARVERKRAREEQVLKRCRQALERSNLVLKQFNASASANPKSRRVESSSSSKKNRPVRSI
ncbi:hypothetical protein AAMO2058_000264800 [Amorphochlora amoebiformis]